MQESVDNVITQAPRDPWSKKDNFAYFNYFNFLFCIPDKKHLSTCQEEDLNFDTENNFSFAGSVKNIPQTLQHKVEGLLPHTLEKRKTLVLDLDETLVHSTFKPTTNYSFTVDVNINGTLHKVYVLKRPGVDQFLKECAKHFELVIFTASLSNYADAVMDVLDADQLIPHRLFRQHCTQMNGNYVKDLSTLGRDLSQVVIVDNSPSCYSAQPQNGIPVTTWFEDPTDIELFRLAKHLAHLPRHHHVYDFVRALQ